MNSRTLKTTLFLAWMTITCLVAIAIGTNTATNWLAVAVVAVVPPLVARRFWRQPEQTMSESIQEARR